jgi:hypothetical protein
MAAKKTKMKPKLKVAPKKPIAKAMKPKVVALKKFIPATAAKVPVTREQAMHSAAKVAEQLAIKKSPITAEAKRDPVDPKDAARAIRQIKALAFSSLATSSAPMPLTTSTDSAFPPRIQALLDKDEITSLMYAYARGIDRAEENLVRSVFHPDGTVDFGPGIFQGTVGDFIAWALDVRGGMKATHHMVGNCRVDLRGDTAFAETYFTAWHRLDKSTGKEDFYLGGRYLDRLERRPGGGNGVWKIMHRKQVKDWSRTMPVAELFYHLNPDALWAHHGKQDLSYHMDNFPSGKGAKAPTYGRRYDAKSMKV